MVSPIAESPQDAPATSVAEATPEQAVEAVAEQPGAVETGSAEVPAAAEPAVAQSQGVPDSNALTQEELDVLASQLAGEAVDTMPTADAAAGPGEPTASEPAPATEATAAAQATGSGERDEPVVVGNTPVRVSAADANPFVAPEVPKTPPADATTIDLLDDVELDVKIELGRANMYIEDVLRLGVGSVVELDKLAGDPVDIYVNDRLIARGEVLVLNENFCVRINHIESPAPELADGS